MVFYLENIYKRSIFVGKKRYMEEGKFNSLIGSVKYIVNDYSNLSNSHSVNIY